MQTLSWVATAFSLAGVWLNAKQRIECWPVWIASNVFWGWYDFATGQIAPFIFVLVLFALNFYGWRRWQWAQRE